MWGFLRTREHLEVLAMFFLLTVLVPMLYGFVSVRIHTFPQSRTVAFQSVSEESDEKGNLSP